jgi:hypothetical protein
MRPALVIGDVPGRTFKTLQEAILSVFQERQTYSLSFEDFRATVGSRRHFVMLPGKGWIPSCQIQPQQLSSALSGSGVFARSGRAANGLWHIRPLDSLFRDGVGLRARVEELLLTRGPLDLASLVAAIGLNETDVDPLRQALAAEFSDADGEYWFAGSPRPIRVAFPRWLDALTEGLAAFPDGASVEDLWRRLCISTVAGVGAVTRRGISRELPRYPEVFGRIGPGRYRLGVAPGAVDWLPDDTLYFPELLDDPGVLMPPLNDGIFWPNPDEAGGTWG